MDALFPDTVFQFHEVRALDLVQFLPLPGLLDPDDDGQLALVDLD